jgi:hypothetical protein
MKLIGVQWKPTPNTSKERKIKIQIGERWVATYLRIRSMSLCLTSFNGIVTVRDAVVVLCTSRHGLSISASFANYSKGFVTLLFLS